PFAPQPRPFPGRGGGSSGEVPPPVETMEGLWSAAEQAAVRQRTLYATVGSRKTVRERLKEMLEETTADEIIATAQIYDHAARLRSFEIAAEVLAGLVRQAPAADRRGQTVAG